jgi:hypothetical protein
LKRRSCLSKSPIAKSAFRIQAAGSSFPQVLKNHPKTTVFLRKIRIAAFLRPLKFFSMQIRKFVCIGWLKKHHSLKTHPAIEI